MHKKLIFPTKVLHLASFWKLQFNSERYTVINTRLIFRGWGTCVITGTLKMHICKWSGPAKTPCYILGRSDIPEFCWRMWTQVFECVKTSKTLACTFFFCVRITRKAKPSWAAEIESHPVHIWHGIACVSFSVKWNCGVLEIRNQTFLTRTVTCNYLVIFTKFLMLMVTIIWLLVVT